MVLLESEKCPEIFNWDYNNVQRKSGFVARIGEMRNGYTNFLGKLQVALYKNTVFNILNLFRYIKHT
jgi:hypothetical protein